MTDNEIIKEIEYCLEQGITSECDRCKDKIGCRDTLLHNALNLINRQKAEIKRKDIEIDILIRKKKTLEDERLELRAEGKRIRITYQDIPVKMERIYRIGGENALVEAIKSEAYKEFAEMLKTKYAKGMNWFKKKESYYVNVGDIDELLTELTERKEDK